MCIVTVAHRTYQNSLTTFATDRLRNRQFRLLQHAQLIDIKINYQSYNNMCTID